jgi:hypothetical protein
VTKVYGTDVFVNERRLLRFLKSEVEFRKGLKRGRKKLISSLDNDEGSEADSDSEKNSHNTGIATVKMYVNALVYFWTKQKYYTIPNPSENPRGMLVKEYLKRLKFQNHQNKLNSFADRGEGTVDSHVRSSEFRILLRYFFLTPAQNLVRSGTIQVLNGLRTRADLLLSRAFSQRGQIQRVLQFADCTVEELPNEGSSGAMALKVRFFHSKTNPFERIQYSGCLRNKNVLECAIGALAFYMFFRFQVSGSQWPSFRSRESYYLCYLLCGGKDGTTPLTYNTQYGILKEAMNQLNIHSKVKTHIGRKLAPKEGIYSGVAKAEASQHGGWQLNSLEASYLNDVLPLGMLRSLAGFTQSHTNYHISREQIVPPPNLQLLVFPFLENSFQEIESFMSLNSCSEFAGLGFLKLMMWLRIVFLQDSSILINMVRILCLMVARV